MAIRKSQLYRSLWDGCDALRGGVEPSQYKDYILTLLFLKYVTDKYLNEDDADIRVFDREHDMAQDPRARTGCSFNDIVALRNRPNIGEGINKILRRFVQMNPSISGIVDTVDFNDENKLGKGDAMVKKLSGLVGIFQREELDFSGNRAEGDDLIGDAYEYLMRLFATVSGKSKGQFYTPAEVSRILAKVVGISGETDNTATVYDPACGSGSLLIRAAAEASVELAPYGQEVDISTAGLAMMNAMLHNQLTTVIRTGSTFSNPAFFETNNPNAVRRFNYIVCNPPFSLKNWQDGVRGHEYNRFSGYDAPPPEKNGDMAWLMHIITSLKQNGKAAVILPHGVLFRGDAEAVIRRNILRRRLIKAIIGLPPNLFYGTGIPACIVVIDREHTGTRDGIFMIDASRDFIKDGDKNRLREKDIYKIVTTLEQRIEEPGYSRMVPMTEIENGNDGNLNIPRYIADPSPKDRQDIDGHIRGGIPDGDFSRFDPVWRIMPELKTTLLESVRPGYSRLAISGSALFDMIAQYPHCREDRAHTRAIFGEWAQAQRRTLETIDGNVDPKAWIVRLAGDLFRRAGACRLFEPYDLYECLMVYWNEVMADDVYLIKAEGYGAARMTDFDMTQATRWEGRLIPKTLIQREFFPAETAHLAQLEAQLAIVEADIDTIENEALQGGRLATALEEERATLKNITGQINGIYATIHTPEIDALQSLLERKLPGKKELDRVMERIPALKLALTGKGTVTRASVNQAIRTLREQVVLPEDVAEDLRELKRWTEAVQKRDEARKNLRAAAAELDGQTRERDGRLTDEEIRYLLIDRKWLASVGNAIENVYDAMIQNFSVALNALHERYARPLPEIEAETKQHEANVKAVLESMAWTW